MQSVARNHLANSLFIFSECLFLYSTVQILSSSSNITSCVNRKVELTCEVQKTSPFCGDVALTWSMKSMKGEADEPLVTCNQTECQGNMTMLAPFVQYQVISDQPHYKLVHLTVTALPDTEGMFICEVDENTKATVKLTLDTSNGENIPLILCIFLLFFAFSDAFDCSIISLLWQLQYA